MMKLPDVRIKKILYATDLSETAVHAFAYAVSLANMYNAGITILHVIKEMPGEPYLSSMISTETWKEIRERHYSKAREALIGKKRDHAVIRDVLQDFSEQAKAEAEDRAFVTDEIIIEKGDPARLIVQTAERGNFDLIVMGTHGHGAMADVLIGSTAKQVIRKSPLPVMVIRVPDKPS